VAFHKLEIMMGFLINDASILNMGLINWNENIISKLNKETYENTNKPFKLTTIFQNLAST